MRAAADTSERGQRVRLEELEVVHARVRLLLDEAREDIPEAGRIDRPG